MRAIVKQDLLCRSSLFTGQGKAVLPAVFPIGPTQRSGRIMLQGLIPTSEGGIFVPSYHAAREFQESPNTFIFPDFLHFLP